MKKTMLYVLLCGTILTVSCSKEATTPVAKTGTPAVADQSVKPTNTDNALSAKTLLGKDEKSISASVKSVKEKQGLTAANGVQFLVNNGNGTSSLIVANGATKTVNADGSVEIILDPLAPAVTVPTPSSLEVSDRCGHNGSNDVLAKIGIHQNAIFCGPSRVTIQDNGYVVVHCGMYTEEYCGIYFAPNNL